MILQFVVYSHFLGSEWRYLELCEVESKYCLYHISIFLPKHNIELFDQMIDNVIKCKHKILLRNRIN